MGRPPAPEDAEAEQQGPALPAAKPKQKRNSRATGVVMLMGLTVCMFFLFLFATFNLEPVQSKENAAASRVTPSAPFNGIVILRVAENHPRKKSQVFVGKPFESDVKMWRKPGKFLPSPLKAVIHWEDILGKGMIPKGLQKVDWAHVLEKNRNQKQNLQMLQKDLNGGNSKAVKGKLVKLEGGRNGILLQVRPGDGVRHHAAASDKKLKMKNDSDVIMLEDNSVEGAGHLSASGKIPKLDEFVKAADVDDEDENEEEYLDNKSDEYLDNSQKEKLDKLKEGIIMKFNQNLQNFEDAEAWGGHEMMEDGVDVENNKAAERKSEKKYGTSREEEKVEGGELEKKYTTSGAEEGIGAGDNALEMEKELTDPEDGGANKISNYKIGERKRRHEKVVHGKPEKPGKKKRKRKAKNNKRRI